MQNNKEPHGIKATKKMSQPSMMQPDSDSEDEILPPGFEERTDEDGNVFYLK